MKLENRISRLEEKLGTKPGPRYTIVTTVDFTDGQEDPLHVKLFSDRPGLWAIAQSGGPFTEEEIQNLRDQHKAKYEEYKAWHGF